MCLETNILTPDNVDAYEFSNKSCLSDLGQGYENKKGGNCAISNPQVLVKFKSPNLAYISKVQVQRDAPGQPPGNVRQIQVLLLNANESIITNEITGEPVGWTSPEDDPTVTGYFNGVRGIIIKVLKTDGSESVKRFRARITGCYVPGLFYSSKFRFGILFSII